MTSRDIYLQKLLKDLTIKDMKIDHPISEWVPLPQYQRLYELAEKALAKAEAYREVAITVANANEMTGPAWSVDKEAAAILERGKGEK